MKEIRVSSSVSGRFECVQDADRMNAVATAGTSIMTFGSSRTSCALCVWSKSPKGVIAQIP